MRFALVMAAVCPDWLTPDFIFRILESKIFSAISWGGAAVVYILGFLAKRKYRDRNLKRLLDGYVEKATKAEGHERGTVKAVIGTAIEKARGLATRGTAAAQFRASDVFENAARFFAQRQPGVAINLLRHEAERCEATIDYAKHQVRAAQERAATAYLEIGSMLRAQGNGVEALEAFRNMLCVNPEDVDALRMLGMQCRDLRQYGEAERWFTTLLHHVEQDVSASADTKRELALVFIDNADLTRAEAVLEEALALERGQSSLRGEALTHELMGVVNTKRKRWKLARRSYRASKPIFKALNDTVNSERIDKRLEELEAARNAHLEARRQRRRGEMRSVRGTGAEEITMH